VEKTTDVLTTGQVAKICNVAPRTVSKWFDSGQLRGYRIPGSKDRRIPVRQLIRFMKAHGIPLNGLETEETCLLIVDDDHELTGLLQKTLTEASRYMIRVAGSAFEAGAVMEAFKPKILLVSLDLPGMDGPTLTRHLSSEVELQRTLLIAMSASLTEVDRHRLLQQGFQNTIAKPFSVQQFTDTIERTLSRTL